MFQERQQPRNEDDREEVEAATAHQVDRVADEGDEPVPSASIGKVTREWTKGVSQKFSGAGGDADDQGREVRVRGNGAALVIERVAHRRDRLSKGD